MARSAALASSSSRMADELPALLHQPAIAARIARPKPQDRDGGALRDRLAHARQRLRPDQRRVGENDQHIIGRPGNGGLGGQHRMGGAAAIGLHENLGARAGALGLGRHRRRRPARPPPRPRCRRPRAARRAHAPAASGPRSHAGPSAARRACGCPRRLRARLQGKSYQTMGLDHLETSAPLILADCSGKAARGAKFTVRRTKSAGFC